MRLGIDLHNVRDGGGINYISNLLQSFDPDKHFFKSICLFGSEETLLRMPDRVYIEKYSQPILAKSLPFRLFFMCFLLTRELRKKRCDLLYSPGGIYFGNFRPFVTISRNMMPYEPQHWAMYQRWSFDRLRLSLLRQVNSFTFRRANGMIFLTSIAERVISSAIHHMRGRTTVIAHGVDRSLFSRKQDQSNQETIDYNGPIRLVYPSRIEPYKHQIEVILAVLELRKEFPQITIDLCGPGNIKYKAMLELICDKIDCNKEFIRYHGELNPTQLPDLYQKSHILLFASSCENLPNTLIEGLSFGIPIVCSNSQPMPEVGGSACIYFNPKDINSIVQSIRTTLYDWPAALIRVEVGKKLASQYSWQKSADETFCFLYKQLIS